MGEVLQCLRLLEARAKAKGFDDGYRLLNGSHVTNSCDLLIGGSHPVINLTHSSFGRCRAVFEDKYFLDLVINEKMPLTDAADGAQKKRGRAAHVQRCMKEKELALEGRISRQEAMCMMCWSPPTYEENGGWC